MEKLTAGALEKKRAAEQELSYSPKPNRHRALWESVAARGDSRLADSLPTKAMLPSQDHTPNQLRLVKPVQSAFMSTGLLSKKSRNRLHDSGQRRYSAPETPCKKTTMNFKLPGGACPSPSERVISSLNIKKHDLDDSSGSDGGSVYNPFSSFIKSNSCPFQADSPGPINRNYDQFSLQPNNNNTLSPGFVFNHYITTYPHILTADYLKWQSQSNCK